MKNFRTLRVGMLIMVAILALEPINAEEVSLPGAIDFSEWDSLVGRTDQLESEVAALRQRLNAVNSGTNCIDMCCCDLVCSGWNANAEYLNWRLRRRGLDFAITTDATALAAGAGDVQNLEFNRDSGMRAGLSYTTKTGWELGFGYTHFNTQATATALEPVGGNMWVTRSHPDQNEEALTAVAFGDLDYDIFDLEIRRWFPINRFAAVQLLGGLRWAKIDQGLRYEYDGADFSNGVFTNPLEMQGFGVRLGAVGHWQLARGFSLFARGAGTLAYGRYQMQLLETNVGGADTIVDVTDQYQQAAPAIELALGASWRNERFEISGGYELTNWFNLADRSMFVDSVHEGAYSPSSMDLLLEGFFLRGGIVF